MWHFVARQNVAGHFDLRHFAAQAHLQVMLKPQYVAPLVRHIAVETHIRAADVTSEPQNRYDLRHFVGEDSYLRSGAGGGQVEAACDEKNADNKSRSAMSDALLHVSF